MVRFVVGRAGCGKTHRCLEAIVQATRSDPLGPPIYLLLPKQATFDAERQLTCLTGLAAFCRPRVVSFEQFVQEMFDECGGSPIPPVTPLGRQMILGHLLRQNRANLKFFSRVARQPGLPAELDATFGELERSGKTSADLAEYIDELSQANPADVEIAPLLDKLHDARLLYDAYAAYLGQDRLDQHRRMLQVQALLSHSRQLGQSQIYVDGFLEFTDDERRILVSAAKAGAHIEITLLMDPQSRLLADPHPLPDEMSLFRRTEETYRKLYFALVQENLEVSEPIRLATVQRFTAPAIATLEAQLFRDPVVASSDSDGMEFVQAPDRLAEVDAAARKIRSLLMNGMRLRDIGLFVRDLDQYHGLIDASFREHGIAYFVDRRRTAAHHPLVRLVRNLFQIARNDWPREAVMSLLRGGLCSVSLYDADGVENYLLRHRIHGGEGWESQRPWQYRKQMLGNDQESSAASMGADEVESIRRRLLETVGPLIEMLRSDEPRPVRQIAAEIFRTLDRFGVRNILSNWVCQSAEALNFEESAEHGQVWSKLVDLFDEMVELLGDEPITPADFYDVLESGLESFDLALTPPTVDQVLVGQADRMRSPQFKAAFVLGLNQTEFPRVPIDGSILNERDRRSLRKRRIDLDHGLQQRMLDERLLGYIAFTRASQLLIVSRPLVDDDGRSAEPSSFWQRLTGLFPDARQSTISSSRKDAAQIATPRQLVAELMRWIRENPDPASTTTGTAFPALYHWFATRDKGDDEIFTMRSRAWPALLYLNEASLSPEIAAALVPAPLNASAAQLETFAACPYQHFARYLLALRPADHQELNAQDLGRLYHDLLENALREVLRRRAEGDSSARLEQAVDRLASQVASALLNEVMLSSARNRYLLDRTRRNLRQTALAQREMLKRGLFRPAQVGVTFGDGGILPPFRLTTPAGAQVLLRGKIDRVDRVESTADVAVMDYRLQKTTLQVGKVLHGLSLQLLTHLLVLEANGQPIAGKRLEAAAAFYLPLLRKIEDVNHPSEAPDPADPASRLKLKPRGLFDRRCLGALDRELQSGSSQVVQAHINKNGELGRRNSSDAAESDEFRRLLNTVAKKLGELADQILSGRIDVKPYRLNNVSPCARCDYRSVCRFDPAINRYNYLNMITREQMAGQVD